MEPASLSPRRRAVLLILLIAIAATGRVAYLVRDRTYLRAGVGEMERAGASLAREGTIAKVYSEETGRSAHVAPLYPYFLAGLYLAFGWDTVAGKIAQELCAIAITVLALALLPVAARAARRSAAPAWVAAFALALLPINLWVETSGAWEQPYAALALLGLLILFCRLADRGWTGRRFLAGGGLLLGAAALLSPALVPAAGLMALAEFAARRGIRKRVTVGLAAMGSVAALTLVPWTLRNYDALGGFVPLRSNLGLELAIGNNPQATGKTFGSDFADADSPFYRMHPLTSAPERDRLMAMGELAYMREKQSTALRWMSENPSEMLRLTLVRFRLYWFPTPDLWAPNSPGAGFKAAFIAAVGLLALLNLARLVITGRGRAWLLLAAVVGPSLAYLVTHIDVRYRYPTFGLCTWLACDLLDSARPYLVRKLRGGAEEPTPAVAGSASRGVTKA